MPKRSPTLVQGNKRKDGSRHITKKATKQSNTLGAKRKRQEDGPSKPRNGASGKLVGGKAASSLLGQKAGRGPKSGLGKQRANGHAKRSKSPGPGSAKRHRTNQKPSKSGSSSKRTPGSRPPPPAAHKRGKPGSSQRGGAAKPKGEHTPLHVLLASQPLVRSVPEARYMDHRHFAIEQSLVTQAKSTPPQYRFIRRNQWLVPRPRRRQVAPGHMDDADLQPCECRRSGSITCLPGCVNAALHAECVGGDGASSSTSSGGGRGAGSSSSTSSSSSGVAKAATNCSLGPACGNRRLQQCAHIKHKLVFYPDKGWGVVATEAKEKGDFLAEYVGEVVDENMMEQRLGEASSAQEQHFYMMQLSNRLYIDSRSKGNFTRFVNHCCDPNAECQTWKVGGEDRVAIFARKTIRPDDELTYDYKWFSKRKYACHCGAANCRGYFGGDDSTLSTAGSDDEGEHVLDGAQVGRGHGAGTGRGVGKGKAKGKKARVHGEQAVALWRTGGVELHEVPPEPRAGLRAARQGGLQLQRAVPLGAAPRGTADWASLGGSGLAPGLARGRGVLLDSDEDSDIDAGDGIGFGNDAASASAGSSVDPGESSVLRSPWERARVISYMDATRRSMSRTTNHSTMAPAWTTDGMRPGIGIKVRVRLARQAAKGNDGAEGLRSGRETTRGAGKGKGKGKGKEIMRSTRSRRGRGPSPTLHAFLLPPAPVLYQPPVPRAAATASLGLSSASSSPVGTASAAARAGAEYASLSAAASSGGSKRDPRRVDSSAWRARQQAASDWAARGAQQRGGGLQVLLRRPIPQSQKTALKELVERADRQGLSFLRKSQAERAERLVLTGAGVPGDSTRDVRRGPLLPPPDSFSFALSPASRGRKAASSLTASYSGAAAQFATGSGIGGTANGEEQGHPAHSFGPRPGFPFLLRNAKAGSDLQSRAHDRRTELQGRGVEERLLREHEEKQEQIEMARASARMVTAGGPSGAGGAGYMASFAQSDDGSSSGSGSETEASTDPGSQ